MEAAIAVGGGVLAIVIVALAFMVHAWGVAGTMWGFVSLATVAGIGYLTWRNRRSIAAYLEKRRKEAAARAAQVAAAMAAAEARKPRPLRGQFPTGTTFLEVGTSLTTDRGTLCAPLVYASAKGALAANEPSLIVAELPVTPIDHACPQPLPYWPSYGKATPDQRAAYLHWLIGGRKQMPPEIGYAFMFFYGLERRALVDQTDHKVIIDEVVRLRKLNAESRQPSRSFDSYTSSFLWFLAAAFAGEVDEATIKAMARSTRTWTEDNLSAAVGWCAQTHRGMPPWLAIEVAGQLPGSQRSVVIERVGERFRELFTKRYTDNYGEGLPVSSSKRRRTYAYKAASAALGTVRYSGPNPMGLMSQLKPLSDLWNSCIDDLRRLSSVVRREAQEQFTPAIPEALPKETLPSTDHLPADGVRKSGVKQEGQEQLTPATWEALPEEIRSSTDHPLLDAVCRFVQESTDQEGRTLMTVRNLAEVLCWEMKDRCSVAGSTWISQTVEDCGYCLEPDARLTNRAYKADDVVTAFLRTTDQQTTTARYAAAACMLRLGIVVAAADGEVHPDELMVLLQDLEQMFDLNDHERRRLEVLRTLVTATGQDLSGLSQMAKLLKPEQREAIAKLLLVLAAKDGEVTREEIRAIRKCYKTLGFAQSDIGHALSSLRAYQQDEEPVMIRPGAAFAVGEVIPAQMHRPVLRLNKIAIARVIADTRDVAQMLAEAMNTGEQRWQTSFATPFVPLHPAAAASGLAVVSPPSEASGIPARPQPPVVSEVNSNVVADKATLPPRYASFYQLLISKQEWDVQEVDSLARAQGLMFRGAIDALNEWAAEKYGGQLFVEDGSRLYIERAYLN